MPSPSLLDRCERRFGHLAIPGLLRIVASFQALCFVILYLKPGFLNFLALTPAAWQEKEIWRFFTFCFIPRDLTLIWIALVIWMLVRIGDVLEAEWGKFRLNLYFAATVVSLWLAFALVGPLGKLGLSFESSSLLYSSLFLAFATVVPDYTLLVFWIMPAKVKWLAWLDAGWLLYLFTSVSYLRLPLVIILLPYAVFGLPVLLRNIKAGHRRAEFRARTAPTGDPFHECSICHRTDHSDPGLEFRIAGDDHEYCAEHLPR